jgi:putative tryptophan/tyrosine transport system substrate-binding protein
LELLKEAVPQLRRAAYLYNPQTASYSGASLRNARIAAAAYGVELIEAAVDSDTEIEGALGSLSREPNCGVIVLTSDFTTLHRQRIIALATRHRLPLISDTSLFADAGGMISYSADFHDNFRSAAGYVDRIVRGEKPADLPVQAPIRFELIVDLKAAKAIGLTIPETFLVRADRVIE